MTIPHLQTFVRTCLSFVGPVLFVGLVSAVDTSAQAPEHEGEIEGVVRDADTGNPLAGVLVSVVGARPAATTHGDGSFHIGGLPAGQHTLRVERLGYRTRTVDVTTGDEGTVVVIELESSPLDVGGLVVTGSLSERDASEALRPVNVLSGQDLQARLEGTVAATLSSEPGVSVTGMGPATAQPVIRGLSGDRVLMLEDGSRSGDMSSTGSDHASALDPSSARRIEVVRGPAAILYGSNALGGVINVIRDEVPSDVPHHPTGAVTLQGQTVTGTLGGNGHMRAAVTDRIPVRVEVGGRSSGDLQTPVGTLENTGTNSWNAGAGAAWVEENGHFGAAFRAHKNDYGIPGGFVGGHEEGVTIEMERMATKVDGRVEGEWGPFRSLELDGQYTWYRHLEIEPPDIIGTFFKRQMTSADVLARHEVWGPFSNGAVGARASMEDFNFAGGLSTPDTKRSTLAAYVFEEIDLEPLRIEAGLRYDWARAEPREPDPDSPIGAIRERTFHAASGSLGVLYNLAGGFTVGTSMARAFRTPDVNELYSEGPHLAAYAFEVGNPSLENEVGTGLDVFVRLEREDVSAELTGFRNDISGYIYPAETADTSRTNLPIYQFRGDDALLLGFEGGVDWNAVGDLTLHGTASYVEGTRDEEDAPLPLIPPLQGTLGLEYDRPDWFVRGETNLAARQDRIGEFETVTPGYAVFDASAGLRLTVSGRLHVLTVSADNVTDAEYRNHLSRVKEIMPEAGRGLSITYRVVF
ncbi:MAG: TonB-dependent receptor [Gemmatimonadota bacterium]|nr:TonB-dependent receptor [Gemmatimonadota bacterium]